MKNLICLLLLLSLIACGKMPHFDDLNGDDKNSSSKNPGEEIVEAIMPEVLDKEGCDMLYPQGVGDVVAVVTCEDVSYILYEDGSFIEGDISELELGESPVEDGEVTEEETPSEENICDNNEELIINGSFEEGHNLGNNQWDLFSSLPGWYSNTLRRNAAMEIQNGNSIGGLAASEGSAKLELDAHNKDGYKKSDAIVVQDIVTKSNESYILSFDYSARVAGNKKTNKAKVYWNGKKIAKLNNNTVGWKSYTILVKSISDIQRLEFVGIHDKDTVGGFIDNVSLKRVCE